jgi:hypothetical protein
MITNTQPRDVLKRHQQTCSPASPSPVACRSPDASTSGDQTPAPQYAVENIPSPEDHAEVIPVSEGRHGIDPEADVELDDSTEAWDNGNGSLLPWLEFANCPLLPEWTSYQDQCLPETDCQATQAQRFLSLSDGPTCRGSDVPYNNVARSAVEAAQGHEFPAYGVDWDQELSQTGPESLSGPILETIDLGRVKQQTSVPDINSKGVKAISTNYLSQRGRISTSIQHHSPR